VVLREAASKGRLGSKSGTGSPSLSVICSGAVGATIGVSAVGNRFDELLCCCVGDEEAESVSLAEPVGAVRLERPVAAPDCEHG
jgi:L-aminopeptidase/D-esterase-like protein